MSNPVLALATYCWVRDRLRNEFPDVDEDTLLDTVEGLTNLHEIVAAIIRSAILDESYAAGLKTRIREMAVRLSRLDESASKKRVLARDLLERSGINKIAAADFSASLRPKSPALVVLEEKEIPSDYWEPQPPKLNRRIIIEELKDGKYVPGTQLSSPEQTLVVRTK